MALVTCKICRRVFINSPQGEENCPECVEKMMDIYPVVRNFLRDNEKTSFSAYDLSRMLNIDLKDIDGLVSMGLIRISDSRAPSERERTRFSGGRLSGETLKSDTSSEQGGSTMHKYKKRKKGESGS